MASSRRRPDNYRSPEKNSRPIGRSPGSKPKPKPLPKPKPKPGPKPKPLPRPKPKPGPTPLPKPKTKGRAAPAAIPAGGRKAVKRRTNAVTRPIIKAANQTVWAAMADSLIKKYGFSAKDAMGLTKKAHGDKIYDIISEGSLSDKMSRKGMSRAADVVSARTYNKKGRRGGATRATMR